MPLAERLPYGPPVRDAAMNAAAPSRPLFLRLPGGSFLHERQLWRHRRLLLQMVRADLRSRYVATSMGFFWSVIHPFLLLLVYIFVFSVVFAQRWEERGGFHFQGNYAVFLCCGLLPWTWLNESLIAASNSVVAQGTLIRKNVFPVVILPFQPILSGLFHFSIAFALFLVYRVATFGFPGVEIALVPLVVVLQAALLMGPALLLATLNVFWRDVSQILTSLLMLLFWLTPIIYLPDMFEPALTARFGASAYGALIWFYWLNPVYHLVALYQRLLFYESIPAWQPAIGVSAGYLLLLSAAAWFLARRLFGRALPRIVEMV
ncbi:MAG: ABC transporter permease [Candidatus Sumerlaeia bacterium]|nr:ABC transporter permease [Candidatus Sumerlaeia bacterium]